jgi:SP family myo-inositol transporter-like MFS transporter 13
LVRVAAIPNPSLFRQTANAILPCTGYDTGVISGTLVSIGTDLDDHLLTSGQKELITSATTLGALIGGLASGVTSDYIGRKWVIGVASVIFVVGALIQGVAHQVSVMVGGRFVIGEKVESRRRLEVEELKSIVLDVGLGVGIASGVVPLYIGEL